MTKELMMMIALIGLLFAILIAPEFISKDAKSKPIALTVESNRNNTFPRLPLRATMIKDKGNEWYEFTLDGKQYLYRYYENVCILIGENDE